MAYTVRPALSSDLAQARESFPNLLRDCWHEGGNRRSFVAVDAAETIVGHYRGIDNAVHPLKRVLVLEARSADTAVATSHRSRASPMGSRVVIVDHEGERR